MQSKNACSQNALPFLCQNENVPCYGNSHKNVLQWLQYSQVHYTDYTIGYLQIFKAGTSFPKSIAMCFNKRSISMVFETKHNYDFIFLPGLVSVISKEERQTSGNSFRNLS